jgi:hypothetical protein
MRRLLWVEVAVRGYFGIGSLRWMMLDLEEEVVVRMLGPLGMNHFHRID